MFAKTITYWMREPREDGKCSFVDLLDKIVPLEVLTLFQRILVGGRFLLIKGKSLEF